MAFFPPARTKRRDKMHCAGYMPGLIALPPCLLGSAHVGEIDHGSDSSRVLPPPLCSTPYLKLNFLKKQHVYVSKNLSVFSVIL